MNMSDIWLTITLILALVLTFLLCIRLQHKLNQERFRNRSLSTKYGKLTEQFLPLVNAYPWNPTNFRFLGSPIDGVQFEEDKVIFVEFKTGMSQLSSRQKEIKALVESGQVMFEIIRVS